MRTDVPCQSAQCYPLVQPYTRTLGMLQGTGSHGSALREIGRTTRSRVRASIKTPCYLDVAAADFQSSATCREILPCGHTCLRKCENCNIRIDRQIVQRSHDACQSQPHNNCSHRCMRQCHGEESCPLCEAPAKFSGHSKCHKKCQESCAPCAQDCSWSCPHCEMPCAVPCSILPCSERSGETLSCGHQRPLVCGEKCPPLNIVRSALPKISKVS